MAHINSKLPLNQDQEKAAEMFFNFLLDPNEKEMRISGPGGVGKTFTMAHMIDEIVPRYQELCKVLGQKPMYDHVHLTATTNQAAAVLTEATGRPADTIFSLLKLRVQEDYTTGEQFLTKTKSWSILKRLIIFIDEAYTLKPSALKFIRESTHQCKIIYVGDHCQLPPVKEAVSPVHKMNTPIAYLLQQMRSNIPEIQALNTQMRDVVEGKKEKVEIRTKKGIIDWHPDGNKAAKVVEDIVLNSNGDYRITAYSNTRVLELSSAARELKGLSFYPEEGEVMLSNTAYNINGDYLSIDQEVTIESFIGEPEEEIIDPDSGARVLIRYANLLTSKGNYLFNVPIIMDSAHCKNLLNYLAKIANWPAFFKLKNEYIDLRGKEVSTVHKTQGSTFETIIIDLDNISDCRNLQLAKHLLYVALSRAKKRIVLVGELSSKLGTIVND